MTITSSRVRALKKLFDKYDSDGSGELDREEVRAMLEEMGLDPTEADMDRVMSRADKDGNESIGFEEFSAGCLDEGDSNAYSGIRRKGSGSMLDRGDSMYLDPRKKNGSIKVWTKSDVEKMLRTESASDLLNKATDPDALQDEIKQQRKTIEGLEGQLSEARAKLARLLGEARTNGGDKEDVPALLSGVLKHTQRANQLASDLNKGSTFSARIFKDTTSGENTVEVNMKTKFGSYFWTLDKFNERYADMLTMHEEWKACKEAGEEWVDKPQEMDPFFDSEYQLIGQATAWLKSLGNMMESSVTSAILNASGNREGEVDISINPCDADGNEGPWDDDDENDPFVDSPDDLKGEEIQFKIHLKTIRWSGVDGDMPYDNTYIRYKFNHENPSDIYSRTDKVKGTIDQLSQEYNFTEDHKIMVDESVAEHLANGRIVFEVWGHCLSSKQDAMRAKMSAVSAIAGAGKK